MWQNIVLLPAAGVVPTVLDARRCFWSAFEGSMGRTPLLLASLSRAFSMRQTFRVVRVCHCRSTRTGAIPRRVSIRVPRPGHLHLRTGSRHRLASNHETYGADAPEFGGNALANGSHATQPSMVRHNLYACACGSAVTALESKSKGDSPSVPYALAISARVGRHS